MNKIAKYTAISVVVATTGLTAFGATAGWGDYRGNCDRKDMGDKHTMMMKRMKKSELKADRDLNLTSDQARTLVEARLIMRGNDRLKVGQISEKDEETYLVDIVTLDDSLVRQIEVDRDNGLPRGPFGPKR
ncbi:MAG: hypothetical protein N0C89_10480 [Candidatus Thiodiazotropha endolucinida]|nr:hypothetical protein [Candidatus Thiodiazotropha taylori]MCG8092284.1 hypothetical protein [Candidatus Thiodiazotropha endolucinida]MCG8061291.1 hypothetical protein [Candidatus Thiodiazotropha taylori]MCG8064558.1 hypothetical protein [Candidatus Thiodiazotropha taylori]MCW4330648.1 hypothetical protein [Candidatus Thiodiazotropha endolucinida]